jgi:ankyrin repeat protein
LQKDIDVNTKDLTYRNPLRHSPTASYETTVRLLLQHGANPNLEEYGITPLIAASQFGHKGVAKILTEEGGAVLTGNLWIVEHYMQP